MHPVVAAVTERIRERSAPTRKAYLDRVERAAATAPARAGVACSNLAHGMAACGAEGKRRIADARVPNLAIVTAYNDMLSAHQPYERFPTLIRDAARDAGGVAQVAGGVPAMCDGVTQGRAGMDLSLFSRDVIALSTALALSHDLFDAALCLGVCDKIAPGMLMGALSFGHLPVLFVPAGPMPTGIPNKDKAAVREAFAAGEVGRDALLASESAAYHSPGTCTFYGTANSNQMLLEFMGLQLPGGSFVQPNTDLRDALTATATRRALQLRRDGDEFTPLGRLLDERVIVNAVVGLLATGGSTNHTLHLPAIAAAAGLVLDWQDFADLGAVIPQLTRVYPNGQADVNHFHAAGGLAFTIRELLDAHLLHDDVMTILGHGLRRFAQDPVLCDDGVRFRPAVATSGDRSVLREAAQPFEKDGGMRVVEGRLGRAVAKVSAVLPQHRRVAAAARVFRSQDEFVAAFEAGQLDRDMVAVVTHQGPAACGMPELHRLTPYLGILQNRGYAVALLTDGRMSGASGKVLAAIHVTPEAARGGLIGRIRNDDPIVIDADAGSIDIGANLDARIDEPIDTEAQQAGCGRELFAGFRARVGDSSTGASTFVDPFAPVSEAAPTVTRRAG
ncbi:MAG: phosphogluconate dehydratase [Pseudomonadota bacterium]